MSIEILDVKTIYQGRAFRVEQDQARMPDGRLASYDVVRHIGAVTLVPVDSQGRMWFVRQFRFGARGDLLELPAGTLNENEDPQVCAAREVREEIGMAAGKLQKIGEAYLAPGYSTEYMHFYLATQLTDSPLEADEDEFLEVVKYPLAEAYALAERGELRDGKSLAALLLARPYLLP